MATLIDSHEAESVAVITTIGPEYYQQEGQAFVMSGDYTLDSCKFNLYILASYPPTNGNVWAELWSANASFIPQSLLATSEYIDATTLSISSTLVTFNFSGVNRYEMTDGNYYAIVLNQDGFGAFDEFVYMAYDSAGSHAGKLCDKISDSWVETGSNDDCIFYLYGDEIVSIQPPAGLTATAGVLDSPYISSAAYDGVDSIDLEFEVQANRYIDLSWTGVTGAVSYNIYRDDVLLDNTSGTSYQDDSLLVDGQLYTYTVTAVDADSNESDPSDAASDTWYAFDHFALLRDTSTPPSPTHEASIGVDFYEDTTSLVSGTTYYYRIYAYNTNDDQIGPSDIVSVLFRPTTGNFLLMFD